TTAGTKVPRVQLYGWSGHQAHDCAEIAGTVQATNPGHYAKGQGRQHQDDNGRTGHLYAGLARLFRLLRNARGADSPHSLGPTATAGRSVAPMENPTAPPRGTHRKWGLIYQSGLQGTRPAAAAVRGISPAAELSLLGSQMHTSNRSACHPCSNRVSVTSRTAVYGPVRTV